MRKIFRFGFNQNNGLTILCYHRVLDKAEADLFLGFVVNASPELFEKEIFFLMRHFTIIPLEKAIETIKDKDLLPKNSLAVTFDDGYRDNYTYAFPILKKYGIPATIFLTTDFIDNKNEWIWTDKIAYLFANTQSRRIDIPNLGIYNLTSRRKRWKAIIDVTEYLKNVNNSTKNDITGLICKKLESGISKDGDKRLYLSRNEILEMSRSNISFGSHGCSHSILTKIDLKEAKREIVDSKIKIENIINKPVRLFAYPNGSIYDFNGELISLLKEFGYKAAFTTLLGKNVTVENLDLFSLKRIPAGRSLMDIKRNLFLYT